MTRTFATHPFPFHNQLEKSGWLATMLTLVAVVTPLARSQRYQMLHNFTGGSDGEQPEAGVTLGDHAVRRLHW